MKHIFLLCLLPFILVSCSGNHLPAKWAVVRAESMFNKAYEMRHDKTKLSKRMQLYASACEQFVIAFQADPTVFTLIRIDNAIMACAWAENHQAKELMRNFEADYIREHPTEAEYGDAMPPMSFE